MLRFYLIKSNIFKNYPNLQIGILTTFTNYRGPCLYNWFLIPGKLLCEKTYSNE
jgi:hypothetical protein